MCIAGYFLNFSFKSTSIAQIDPCITYPTWPLSLTLLFVKCCNGTLQEGQMEESDDDDSDLDEDFGVGK